jgi:hypothetical protein
VVRTGHRLRVSLCRKQAGSASRTRGRVGPAQGRRDRGALCSLRASSEAGNA